MFYRSFNLTKISGQTSGQDTDGEASESSSPSQQRNMSFPEVSNTQETGEGDVDQETNENVDETGGGGLDDDDKEEEEQEQGDDGDEECDDFDINNELPERPSSRHDFSSDEEGNTITFQQRHKRLSKSPALSSISEDSNETKRSRSASRRVDRQPGLRVNRPSGSEPDDAQEGPTLADVAETRSRLFDRLLARIGNESLYTNAQALMAAITTGAMPGQEASRWWNADDLETRFMGYIEEFRQVNAQPRDDGTVLPVEMQNQITEQLQGLAFVLQEEAVRWLAGGLTHDTEWMMQMTNSIDHLLEDRPRVMPSSRTPSMGSNGSGPERVLPVLDRQRLRRLDREELVNIILQQDDDRRADMDQFEADIEVATTQANAERDEAQVALQQLTAYTQQLREVAHDNGLNNRDLDGRPLRVDQTHDRVTGNEQEDPHEYTDRIEGELDACTKARGKDAETLKHLRLENADLNANLENAREEARQAVEELERIRQSKVNTVSRESVDALSGQERSNAPSNEVSPLGQEPPPSSTSFSSEQDTTADRQPPNDTDADLEALRSEHRQEIARLTADYEKEISELRKDIDDDRRGAQGNLQQDLEVELSGQDDSIKSVSSQATGRHESSDNASVTGVAPGLESLLDSLWEDDDGSADLMAMADQAAQEEQAGQVEPALASPAKEDSQSDSAERRVSTTAANEKGKLETRVQELAAANVTLQRRVNTLEQMREGGTARTRELEGLRNALQNALQETIPRYEALQEQLAVLERVRTRLQQDLRNSREAQQQQADELKRLRNTLQLHQGSSQTAQDAIEKNASQQLVTDLRRQLRECQQHRAAQAPTSAADDPEQAVRLVDRLLQVFNQLRQLTPHANEVAQFATVMVQAGRRAPAELDIELQQVTGLAERVRWPNDELDITPEQRGDPEQLAAVLGAWLSAVEAAIDDSVRLSAAVGSLRVAVDIWNTLNPSGLAGSRGSLSVDRGSKRSSSQAGPPSNYRSEGRSSQSGPPAGHSSVASTTSSFNSQERGQLLNLAAQVANQHAREHPEVPLDEAQRLIIAGRAADLYLRRLMGEQSDAGGDGEGSEVREGQTEPSVTDGDEDVESISAHSRSASRPDRTRPVYIDPAWLSLHPSGPCDQCAPVLRFPVALFPGGADTGPCNCGPADTVDSHIAALRSSRGSGTRSVAFSDDLGQDDIDAPGGGATSKSPRSILKKPSSIDTTRTKARRKGTPPRSPYPITARSLLAWDAAQLPSPLRTQRSQSASSARSRSSPSLPTRQLSLDVFVPIMPVQKSCCEHFDELKRVCVCKGICEDHWCCKHWDLTGVCKCKGECHEPCCTHWDPQTNVCTCTEMCPEHTATKCCLCGFKPGVVANVCACDKTCRDHAVCEDFRAFKPRELSCMAGCDDFNKDGKCEHGGVCRQSPCDSHPCCTHHVNKDGRAYCGCGKTCALHVCCSHYLPGFKTCECQGTCVDHLPVIPRPLRQHFRDVAAVAEAQTSPSNLVDELYYPAGRMFPRQEGQAYDWNEVVRANMDLLRRHSMLGPNDEIMILDGVPASGRTQRVDSASAVPIQVSPALDGRQTASARNQASQDVSASLTTSTAPPAPPGAYQAALRGGSGVPRGARHEARGSGLRNNALPDVPRPETGRLLSDSLLEFHGPRPDFDNDGDSTRSTRASPRRAVCAAGGGGGHAGCGCKCRCRGDDYHVLTGPGGRFAFYTCRRMHGGGSARSDVADEEGQDADGDEDVDVDSTRAAGGSSNYSQDSISEARSRQSSQQPSQRETASRQGSQMSDSQGASSQRSSRQGSHSDVSQGSRQNSQVSASQTGSRQSFQSTRSQSGSQSSRQSSQVAASQAGSRQSFQSSRSQTGSEHDSQRSSTGSGPSSATEHGPDDQEPDKGESDDGGPEPNDPDDAGGGGGGGGGSRRPRQRNRRPAPNPWRQIWDFIWHLIRFFTYRQVANLLVIFRFAYDFVLLNIQHALHFLHLADPWQLLPNPHLPHAEIVSFVHWLLLVWLLTMMIALGEERRLWLAANPRTAAYVRGLQFRNPYPPWSLFQVDYALLGPAWSGLSAWLHRLYFRPGVLGSVGDAFGVKGGFGQAWSKTLSYSRIEEAVVHVKDMVLNAGSAVATFALGLLTAVWAFIERLVPGRPGVSSMRPGYPSAAPVSLETPVMRVHPPNLSGPQVVHGGPAWWESFWEYLADLVVRTVTGRRKVGN